MPNIREIKLGEQTIHAHQVAYEPHSEPWSEYEVNVGDGVIMRVRAVATRVWKLYEPDGTPKINPADGTPVLHADCEIQISTRPLR